MARNTDSKCKQCRREGTKLFLKGERCTTGKCAISRRAYIPGQHGPTHRVKMTTYGKQLREKQKAKNSYGILERQFRNYFIKATRQVGNTADILVQLLEFRLDNVVYRLGLAKSRALARQMSAHGLIRVNGRKVTIPSYQVKAGDVITLSPAYAKSKTVVDDTDRISKHETPGWLFLDSAAKSGKILSKPTGKDLQQNFDPKLIVEFYSR